MGSGNYDILIEAGDDVSVEFVFDLFDDPDPDQATKLDLTGATLRSQARRKKTDPDVLLELAQYMSIPVGTDGRIVMAIPKEDVFQLLADNGNPASIKGEWDLEVTLATTQSRRYLKGTILFDLSSTR